MKEPQTLQEAIKYFSDEQVCIDRVAAMRWPNGKPTCPACGHTENWYLKAQKRWKCKECHKQFTVKLGTIFEDSPITLDKWLTALWLICNCKNGVSSYEVARDLGITQKSSWFMLHRIRAAMKSGSIDKLGGGGGPVEADETFVGANPMRMHKKRRAKMQAIASNTYGMRRHAIGKTIVMGMLDREAREVRASVIPDVKRATLQEQILKHIKSGSTVFTDEHTSYKYALVDEYAHEVVNHMQGYVDGQVHTNGIENFWSLLKRGLRGTYVAVEPFHLDRYVDEQVFRFNNRIDMTDADRFNKALSQIAGKRLTYAELTGKTTTTPF